MRKRRLKKPPMVIHLALTAVQDVHGLFDFFAADSKWTRHQVRELHNLFALHEDERSFAHTLLTHKPHYWLFRSNQRCFCGDFIVVDMSNPDLEKRKVYVIDLKQNVTLKMGGGGASNQFQNARRAVRRIARKTGAVTKGTPFEKLVGDKDELLEFLGVTPEIFAGTEAPPPQAQALSGEAHGLR